MSARSVQVGGATVTPVDDAPSEEWSRSEKKVDWGAVKGYCQAFPGQWMMVEADLVEGTFRTASSRITSEDCFESRIRHGVMYLRYVGGVTA